MSFILEALRKAERERNLGQVPALRIAAAPAYSARRGFSPWWIAVVAVLAGAAIGAAGWWRQQASDESVAVARAPEPTPAPAPQPTEPAPEPVPPLTERVEVQTAQGPVEMEIPPAPPPSAPAPQPLPQLPVAPEAEPPAADVQEAPATAEPDAAELPAMEQSANEDVPIEPIGPETPELPPEQPLVEDLPSYNGLPESLRSAIPQLSMNAHVYSSTPGRGFVMINGKKYRQGDKLAEGPEVVHILPDSVVLTYRGTDFLLPVPR